MNISIRNETGSDHKQVEELTREAFWNLYVPGCDEHYLVHIMRNHPDFIAELDFVAIYENRVIGNIMYSKSYVADKKDLTFKVDTITFGPVSVLPEFQKQGVGSALIKHSINIAKENGYKSIIIQGHPHNYCKHGFKSSKDFGISDSEGKYPYSLLVLELENEIFRGNEWKYYSSDVYDVDQNAVKKFDNHFKTKKKEFQYTQEEFSIACRAYII
ncbi:MAG: N-acetyltransferase [Spirochaetota bacterium]|nr:N-acetyltransferase [Spirochaetota bacterium]